MKEDKMHIKNQLDRVNGLLVMLDDDREMFGFVEEDQRKYDTLLRKKQDLTAILDKLTH